MFFLSKNRNKSYDYEMVFNKLMTQLDSLDLSSENIREILKSILNFVSAESGSLFLYQQESKLFMCKVWIVSEPLNVSVDLNYEFITYLKQTQNVLFKKEIVKDNRYLDLRSSGIHYFTQLSCNVVVPLVLKNQWIGLLNIGNSLKGVPYTEGDRSMMLLIGYWLAHYISNALLYNQTMSQKKKLEEVTELKNQLLANVTHELRTPLNGILGLADLIIDGSDGEINEDQRRHLSMIKAAGESLLDIVNNILSLLKVEANKGEIEIRKLDLARMIEEVGALFEGINVSNQNEFSVHVSKEINVYGDEDQVRTVLMNLVGNATKFTKNGRIDVLASRSGEMVRVCVKDTGIGIAEDDQHKIFEEFRQGDGSITRSFGGTGLGLAIAKKIVELHGGRIWVDSVQGRGSEFFFTLPMRPTRIQGAEMR